MLALLASATFGLIWSYLQFNQMVGWDTLFLVLFGVSNIVLFGGVYWSKFAHMFYKPGAAIQKNLAEADGSKPWGKFIPKLADGDKPNQGEINSQILYNEPHGLNTDKDLPTLDKNSFKKGVYY